MEKLSEWRAGEVQLTYKRQDTNKDKVVSSSDATAFLRRIYGDAIEHREMFIVLGLNRANEINSYYVAGVGGVSGTVADPKVIMQYLLLSNSCGCIVSHNHPSGNTRPSSQDRRLTQTLSDACKSLDIALLDHVILTAGSQYSFADHDEI